MSLLLCICAFVTSVLYVFTGFEKTVFLILACVFGILAISWKYIKKLYALIKDKYNKGDTL